MKRLGKRGKKYHFFSYLLSLSGLLVILIFLPAALRGWEIGSYSFSFTLFLMMLYSFSTCILLKFGKKLDKMANIMDQQMKNSSR